MLLLVIEEYMGRKSTEYFIFRYTT